MKNTIKLLLIVAVFWFPTLDPSDIVVFAIIKKLGMTIYLLLSAVFAIYLYNHIEGRTIADKLRAVKKEFGF